MSISVSIPILFYKYYRTYYARGASANNTNTNTKCQPPLATPPRFIFFSFITITSYYKIKKDIKSSTNTR